MTSTEIRDRRRTLPLPRTASEQMVQMKNRISGLLMETVRVSTSSDDKVATSRVMSGSEEIELCQAC